MSKRKIQEHKEKSWNPLESYQKVCNTINAWPNWKKMAYNEMFAISAHAEKLRIE